MHTIQMASAVEEQEQVYRLLEENSDIATQLSKTPTILQVRLENSRVRSCTLKLHWLDGFPATALHLEVESNTLPHTVRKLLEARCSGEAKKAQAAGQPQGPAVLTAGITLFRNSLLLPCVAEITELKTHLPVWFPEEKAPASLLQLSEAKGTIRLTAKYRGYQATMEAKVPLAYPDEAPVLSFKQTNFSTAVLKVVQAHANDLLRAHAAGTTQTKHLKFLIHADKPAATGSGEAEASTPTVSDLSATMNDVKWLQRSAELKAHSDDRDARRRLVRMVKAEVQTRQREEEEAAAKKARGPDRLPGVPSILPLFAFLYEHLVRLPDLECQRCNKPLLLADPATLAGYKSTDDGYPMVALCGHWMHRSCLVTALTTPPFVKPCAICNERLAHLKWNKEVHVLEKRWAAEQARIREMAEISDFLLG